MFLGISSGGHDEYNYLKRLRDDVINMACAADTTDNTVAMCEEEEVDRTRE